MPINTKHPDYDVSKSEVCEDAYKGNVIDYVPRLSRQTNEEYDAYRKRGVYFNVTKKTVEAAVGAILRKPYVTNIEDTDVMIDQQITLSEYINQILHIITIQGKSGLLCDYSEESQSPYLVMYDRDDIINWRADGSLVVLEEDLYVQDPKDPYKLTEIEQYRELYIDEDGYYAVRLWREDGRNNFIVVDEYFPMVKGERLDHIPFVFVNPFDTTTAEYDPPILNTAQLNISHFKSVVDLEHGVHFTALPQPVIVGEFTEDQGTEIAIGQPSPWQLEMGSSATYLEFTGAGLSSIERRIDKKEEQMAYLSGQLLDNKKGVESTDSIRLRGASNHSTLINIVNAVESAIQQILHEYFMWSGRTEEVIFQMNRDFTVASLTPAETKALMELYLNDTISQETFLENLYGGEITSDVEQEMQRLRNESAPQPNNA